MPSTTLPVPEYPGVKYPGRMKIGGIVEELDRQAANYKDFVVPTSVVRVMPDDEHGMVLEFEIKAGETMTAPISKRGYMQIAQWIGLPTNSRLYKRLRYGSDSVKLRRQGKVDDKFWQTYMDLVNAHFKLVRARKLVRLLKDHSGQWYVRAILSDRYRVIPNDQLFMIAAEKIKAINAEIWDARLSEDAFYVYCVAPGISAQIRSDRSFGEVRWGGDAGDSVNAAIMLRNSETGQGGCEVCLAIVTSVTGSYFVRHNPLSIRHLGGKHKMDMLLSASTVKAQNEAIFGQIRDYIDSAFDPDKFQDFVDSMQDATQDELEDPVAAAEATRLVYDLSEDRKRNIVKWLMESGDRSRYGLAQAVVREAHDNDKLGADEAVHLERVGSELIAKQTSLKLAKAYKSKAELKAVKAARKAEAEADVKDDSLDF